MGGDEWREWRSVDRVYGWRVESGEGRDLVRGEELCLVERGGSEGGVMRGDCKGKVINVGSR